MRRRSCAAASTTRERLRTQHVDPAGKLVAAQSVADGLVLTEIQRDYAGDTRFPDFDRAAWRETQRKPHTGADGLRFDFVLYERA